MTDTIDTINNHTRGWNTTDESYLSGTRRRGEGISSAAIPPSLPPPARLDTIESMEVGGVAGIAKKIWDFLSYPFSKSAVDSALTAKPGPKGLNGIPALESAFQIDQVAMQKLMTELKEMVDQVVKSSNDADEELQDKDRLQAVVLLIDYLKKQEKIRHDGVNNHKFDLVFHTKQNEAVRRTLDDVEMAIISTNNSREFWGTVNSGLKWAAVAVFTGTVALSVFTMSGGAAVPMVVLSMSKIPNAFLTISSAATQIMKAKLDSDFGQGKERSENMRSWRFQNNLRIEATIENVNNSFDMAQKVRGWLFQVLKNQQDAVHNVNGGRGGE